MRNSNQPFFPVLLAAVFFIAGCGQNGPADNGATTTATTASHDSATTADKNMNTPTTPINLQKDSSYTLSPAFRVVPTVGPTKMTASIDSSHGIRYVNMTVNPAAGNEDNYIMIDTAKCRFVKFHFHRPAEHLYAGKRYPMEMHLVFQKVSKPDSNIVISIFMDTGKVTNPFIGNLWRTFRAVLQTGKPETASVDFGKFDYLGGGLIKYVQQYWNYPGSLTTPDFDKVNWFVSNTIYGIPASQVDTFAQFKCNGVNLGPALGQQPVGSLHRVGRSFQMK